MTPTMPALKWCPATRRPLRITPVPTPIPQVVTSTFSRPRAVPNRVSKSAMELDKELIFIGMPRRSTSFDRKGTFSHLK